MAADAIRGGAGNDYAARTQTVPIADGRVLDADGEGEFVMRSC